MPEPTERNVNPFLFQTGIRAVKKLVLALTIHDENITKVEPTRAGFTVMARVPKLTDLMSFASPHSPNNGSCQECDSNPVPRAVTSTTQQFVAPSLCLGTHKYEQEHGRKRSQGTDHAVWYDPFFTQSPAAERADNTPSPRKAP